MSKGGTTTSTSEIDPQIKQAFLTNFQQAQNVAGALPVQQIALPPRTAVQLPSMMVQPTFPALPCRLFLSP